jgi:hypothetical protein
MSFAETIVPPTLSQSFCAFAASTSAIESFAPSAQA